MCGITGWVDYARDLTTERATVRAMTATMALRGPDAEGIWLDRHAGFGHRRLAVIDLPGGVQPMTVERDGAVLAAITYSGEVYNYRELREQLRGRGHAFRTDSDTEVVLHAYLEWGDRFVERLNGMYAFGMWDAVRERLLLVRDRMGIKPLFYRPAPDGVLFASEPKGILAHPEVTPVVRADGLRELFTFVKTPGMSLYHGMFEVRPGHLVAVDRSGVHERRYWGLAAAEHRDDRATTVATVRELLEDIVARQLISDVPLCTLLSGGLDSSAITAMAAASLRRGGDTVHSFAVDFVGQTERFRPDGMRDTADAPFVRQVADHVKADHTDIVLDTAVLTDPLPRGAVLMADDSPLGTGDMYTSLYLLFRAVREHSVVALSGESADEVFGGYAWFHDPDVVNRPTFPWLAAFARQLGYEPGGPGGRPVVRDLEVLDRGLVRDLDLDGYRREAYRQALAQVEHLPGEDATEFRMREVCYLHLTRFLQVLLDRKDRMSMAHGLEVRVPFCDHRLVEYVYNTPWSLKTFDGREKSLLRAATADLLPEAVVRRRKSPYPTTQDPAYERVLSERFRALLADRNAPVTDLLDLERAQHVARTDDADPGSPLGLRRRTAELVLGLDQWLRRYPIRLDPTP